MVVTFMDQTTGYLEELKYLPTRIESLENKIMC